MGSVLVKSANDVLLEELEKEKDKKLREAKSQMEADVAAIHEGYPEVERDSWDKQEKEARSYKADPTNAVVPWLEKAAASRWPNMTLSDAMLQLTERIIAKADYAASVHGEATGKRQNVEDAVMVIYEDANRTMEQKITDIKSIVVG